MKKLNILIVVGLIILACVVGMVSAGEYLQEVKQGEDITLRQTCPDCTFVEFTSMTYPNQTVTQFNVNMTKVGEDYTYLFGNTTELGTYEFKSCGDLLSQATNTRILKCETIIWEVTPSGSGGSENIVFFIFLIFLIYAINLFGFFGRNIPMTILGGMALIFLGIYMISHGIIIYRDNLTNYVAYVTIAWGFISAMLAGFEMLQDM